MNYELIESPTNPGHWHVEAFDEEGECIKAVFSGPAALEFAESYIARQQFLCDNDLGIFTTLGVKVL